MAKNIEAIPYTEIFERVIQITRSESVNDYSRVRGAIQDIALRKIPAEEDWSFYRVSSAITCDAKLATGTVSVNTQASAATFSSDVTLTASMTGRKIKFNGNNDVYDLTFDNTTGATISPVLSGDQNISSGPYTIYQGIYALAPDFDRFPKNGGLLLYQGGRPTVIPEKSFQYHYKDYSSSAGTPESCRLVTYGTSGVPHVEVMPPPSKAINLPYEYFRRPTALRETTAGTCTVSAGGTSVTFHAGASLTEARTGYYFRINAFGVGADSEWYKVSGINATNSTATLNLAFGVSGATSAGYTLSAVPDMPEKMQPAVLHGAVASITADQNDQLNQLYDAKYRETINDGKRTYKTRIYNQDIELAFEDYNFRR